MVRCLSVLLLGLLTLTEVRADVIASDVSVQMSASPTVDLVPGQIVHFTLSVTNNGASVVTFLPVLSSSFFDEFDLSKSSNDCLMMLVVADTETSFYYYHSWIPTTRAPIAPGETRICHFQMALSVNAPSVVPLTFGLESDITDPNPSNDSTTVLLRQRVESVPTISVPMMAILTTLLALTGLMLVRKCEGET